jgi:hypothetical protein
MHAGHASHAAAIDADQSKLLADKRESEFNHHLAGVLVILAGAFILAEGSLRGRWPSVRFVWPMCLLVAGLFLLVFSDTELWPFGAMSWWYGLTHRTEDLQHKTFAVILLGLAFIELQSARGVLKAAWSGWVFPVFAAIGSVLLLFHEHGGAHAGDHMAVMQRIQSQHVGFAITGFGISLAKGRSETGNRWQSIFAKLWPVFMIVLGLLLLLYRE